MSKAEVLGFLSGSAGTVNYPAGKAAGDVCLLWLSTDASSATNFSVTATVTIPAGFTELAYRDAYDYFTGGSELDPSGARITSRLCYRILDGTDGASATYTADLCRGVLIRTPFTPTSAAFYDTVGDNTSSISNRNLGSSAAAIPSLVFGAVGKASSSLTGLTLDGAGAGDVNFVYELLNASPRDVILNAAGDPISISAGSGAAKSTAYAEFCAGYLEIA